MPKTNFFLLFWFFSFFPRSASVSGEKSQVPKPYTLRRATWFATYHQWDNVYVLQCAQTFFFSFFFFVATYPLWIISIHYNVRSHFFFSTFLHLRIIVLQCAQT